jgi:hypothetical protein
MKEAETVLIGDQLKLSHIMNQIESITGQITQLQKGFDRSTEAAIVASSDRIRALASTYTNFTHKLLNSHPPVSFTVRIKDIPNMPVFNLNLSYCKRFIESMGDVSQAAGFSTMQLQGHSPVRVN